jgi:hypothetical protein
MWFVIPIIILISCAILYKPLQEGFYTAISYFIDTIWSQSFFTWSKLHKYNNSCLTSKPYGSPGSEGPLSNWAEREKYMRQEYASCSAYRCGDLSALKDNEPIGVQNLRRIRVSSIPEEYYHNPVDYCRAHPDSYPCPNHWLASPGEPAADSRLDHKILPAPLQGLAKHIKDSQINDNYHTRVLYPQREDHGLC